MINRICSSRKVILRNVEQLTFCRNYRAHLILQLLSLQIVSDSAYDAIHSLQSIPFSFLFSYFHDKFAKPRIQDNASISPIQVDSNRVQIIIFIHASGSNCWFSVSHHSTQITIKSKVSMQRLLPNLQGFVWRGHSGAHPDGHNMAARNRTETSVIEFCYKSVNLFLEELISIKIILFLNT